MVFSFGRSRALSHATAAGERIYAIGDVHGCYSQLQGLLGRIENHVQALPKARSTHIILLGDLIDRGPDSAKVLRSLYKLQQETDKLIVLMGNHEELMLRALDGEPGMMRAWMRIGGDATLRSFGLEPPGRDEDPRRAIEKVRQVIPAEWVSWIRGLPLTARSGDYLFCHAGVRPGVAFKRQKRADLLWIRDEFLHDDETRHEAVVVHGHSISAEVEMRPYRIGLDTGAYRTGVLTGLYLEGEQREIITSGMGSNTERAA